MGMGSSLVARRPGRWAAAQRERTPGAGHAALQPSSSPLPCPPTHARPALLPAAPSPPPPATACCARCWRTARCTARLLGSPASRWAWSTHTTATCPVSAPGVTGEGEGQGERGQAASAGGEVHGAGMHWPSSVWPAGLAPWSVQPVLQAWRAPRPPPACLSPRSSAHHPGAAAGGPQRGAVEPAALQHRAAQLPLTGWWSRLWVATHATAAQSPILVYSYCPLPPTGLLQPAALVALLTASPLNTCPDCSPFRCALLAAMLVSDICSIPTSRTEAVSLFFVFVPCPLLQLGNTLARWTCLDYVACTCTAQGGGAPDGEACMESAVRKAAFSHDPASLSGRHVGRRGAAAAAGEGGGAGARCSLPSSRCKQLQQHSGTPTHVQVQRFTTALPWLPQAGEQQGGAAGPPGGQADDELAGLSKTQRKKLMKRQL